jgi:hypothetical protein
VIKHFKNDNDKFAKAAWGTSWTTAFPDDIKLLQRKKQIYQPQSIEEEETMHAITIHLLRRIRHKIKPKLHYRIVDPLERIANFLSPSISLRTIRYVKIHLLQLGKP